MSKSMMALIGDKVSDRELVGRYLAAFTYYRKRLIAACTLGMLITFYFVGKRYGWSNELLFWLWGCLSLSMVFNAHVTQLSPLILLKRDLHTNYSISASTGGFRLALLIIAYLCGIFVLPLIILTGTLHMWANRWLLVRATNEMITPPRVGTSIEKEKKALKKLTLPHVPGHSFSAFEGQISVFLLGILGTQSGIAELGAISRIGMLFIIFGEFGRTVIGPYFAQISKQVVLTRAALVMLGGFAFFSVISGIAWLFPTLFLWILGDGYQHLHFEIFLLVLTCSIRSMNVFAYSICVSRKYIYSWYPTVDVLPVILTMIGCYMWMDLGQLINVLWLGFYVVTARLISKVFVLAIGQIKGPAV